MPMDHWKIQLLGGLVAQQGERTIDRFRTRKGGEMLAALALHLIRALPREELLALLWPDEEPEAGRNRLQFAIDEVQHLDRPIGVFEEKIAKEATRLKRRGWSEAKIERAISDRRKADARPGGGGSDSLELWNAVLNDLRQELKLPYVGLLVRLYSGAIATEVFNASRRQVSRTEEWQDALGSMEHDEVTIFHLK